ncbi:hypothetical protein [Nesterenkonia sp. K-15-9-6]|uniref:hypothetical protein n=1 Tax=Nesterenkonia sp. K-15-9-6 TaxID=3093918 RepID=UPI004044FA2A
MSFELDPRLVDGWPWAPAAVLGFAALWLLVSWRVFLWPRREANTVKIREGQGLDLAAHHRRARGPGQDRSMVVIERREQLPFTWVGAVLPSQEHPGAFEAYWGQGLRFPRLFSGAPTRFERWKSFTSRERALSFVAQCEAAHQARGLAGPAGLHRSGEGTP